MKARERAAARAVLYAAHRKYGGGSSFPVDERGKNWDPLKAAEFLGWARFTGTRCAITTDGLAAIADYLGDGQVAATSYNCQVCGFPVVQPDGGNGLPATVGCPTCAAASREAADTMRERA
jgi:rubrerythrin